MLLDRPFLPSLWGTCQESLSIRRLKFWLTYLLFSVLLLLLVVFCMVTILELLVVFLPWRSLLIPLAQLMQPLVKGSSLLLHRHLSSPFCQLVLSLVRFLPVPLVISLDVDGVWFLLFSLFSTSVSSFKWLQATFPCSLLVDFLLVSVLV